MKAQVTEQPTNGTIETSLTAEQKLSAFQAELMILMDKYGVQLVPYIIILNDGRQLADAKYMLVQK